MVNSMKFTRRLVKRVRTVSFALGFEARRVPRIPRRQRLPRSDGDPAPGRIIELIGPSAIGKSTFLEHLHETSASEDEFLVLPRKFRVQCRSLSKNRWNDSDRRWLDLWTCRQEIKGLPRIHPCDDSGEASKILRDERRIRTLQVSRSFVIDHSLAQFFSNELRSYAVDNEELFDDLMHRRAIVVCCADPTIILQRLHQRAARGVKRVAHLDQSDEALLELSRMNLRRWLDYGEFLASRGVPVLVLDLESQLDVSKGKLRDFVRSLT
jgi:energy-coupling factor transporter ATP-binding protein EcfA2